MFEGHDPYLVALSVAIAILGGYTGFGLTARIRGMPDASHRLLLAGEAAAAHERRAHEHGESSVFLQARRFRPAARGIEAARRHTEEAAEHPH